MRPAARPRYKKGLDGLQAMRAFDLEARPPGRFRDQQQGVEMWSNANLVPGHLVRPAPGVLGLRRREAFSAF